MFIYLSDDYVDNLHTAYLILKKILGKYLVLHSIVYKLSKSKISRGVANVLSLEVKL